MNTGPGVPGTHSRHPVARVLAWILGVVAVAMTGLLAYIGISVAAEWSGYVGGESGVALAVLGFVALATLVAWIAFLIPLLMARRG